VHLGLERPAFELPTETIVSAAADRFPVIEDKSIDIFAEDTDRDGAYALRVVFGAEVDVVGELGLQIRIVTLDAGDRVISGAVRVVVVVVQVAHLDLGDQLGEAGATNAGREAAAK